MTNQTITPSVRITADTWRGRRAWSTDTGRRRLSSHEIANIPGPAGIPPYGAMIGPNG